MSANFINGEERLWCTLCSGRCFTPGTLRVGSEVINREFYYHVGVSQFVVHDAGDRGI
jgi:hypothetical protein